MTDKELIELLPEYVNDSLDHTARREIESRLAQSEELRTALGAARRSTRIINRTESKLASEKFLEKVHRRTDDKHEGVDRGLRPAHSGLPIRIAGGLAILVLIALLFNNFTGNQYFKKIFSRQEPGHETSPGLPASSAFFKKKTASGVDIVNKRMNPAGQAQREEAPEVPSGSNVAGTVAAAAIATNDTKTPRSSVGTAGQMKTTSLRNMTSARAPSVLIPSPARKGEGDQVEEPRQDENGGFNSDEQVAFYEPVNMNKKNRTGSVNSRSIQIKQAGKASAAPAMNPGTKNKAGVISGTVMRYGGIVDSILEHNGDYYKVKIFLPGRKLEPFKKALASEAVFASFTVAPVSPGSSTIEVILETHAPR